MINFLDIIPPPKGETDTQIIILIFLSIISIITMYFSWRKKNVRTSKEQTIRND